MAGTVKTAGFLVKIEKDWHGEEIKGELWAALQKSLPKLGELGAEKMRANIRGHRKTGEVEASIMWSTYDRRSAIGPPARSEEKILSPRSMRSVFIGSAMGAGRYTKSGKRISIVTSIEYGTRHSGATPFILPVISQIRVAASQLYGEEIREVIEKSRPRKAG